MTLVVARLFSDGPRLLADSQLTRGCDTLNPFTAGALKAVILHRGLCVAFAGGEITGPRAIRGLAVSRATGFDVGDVYAHLFRSAKRCKDSFVVASLTPAPELALVDESGVSRGRDSAWIGDGAAHEEYLARLARADEIPFTGTISPLPASRMREVSAWNRMFPAFVGVLDDTRHPGVGGMPISVGPTDSGFRYESSAYLAADHEQTIRPEDGWVDADWGTAAEGGFGFAVKTPDEAGIGAVGAYFPHARLAVLYYPSRYEQAIRWSDIAETEFAAAVKTEFGFSFGQRSLGFGTN